MRKLPLFRRFAGAKQGKAHGEDNGKWSRRPVTAAALLKRLRFFEVTRRGRLPYVRRQTRLGARRRYSDTKEAFHEAIAFAWRLKLTRETKRLGRRLAEIKMIYRHQFPA
jgi:hypothetical protein